MATDLDRFLRTFFEEAGEHLAVMEAGLLDLEERLGDADLLNSVFRGAHSIKGASGTFGLTDVARFTHTLENLLDQMRQRVIEPSPPLIDLLLRATDCLRGLIVAAQTGSAAPDHVDDMRLALQAALGTTDGGETSTVNAGGGTSELAQPCEYRIAFAPKPDLLRQGADPILLFREVAESGQDLVSVADLSRLPSLRAMDPEACYLSWDLRLRSTQSSASFASVFAFVADECDLSIEASQLASAVPPVCALAPTDGVLCSVRLDDGVRLLELCGSVLGAARAFQDCADKVTTVFFR